MKTYKSVFTFQECKGTFFQFFQKREKWNSKHVDVDTDTIRNLLPKLDRPTMIDVILAVQKSSIYPNHHVLRNEEAYLIKKATCEILDDAKIPPTRKELKMVKKVLSISDEMRALMKRKQDELVKKFCTKCGSKRKAVPYGKDRVKFICSKRCKRKSPVFERIDVDRW